jgi:hypothetical protein
MVLIAPDTTGVIGLDFSVEIYRIFLHRAVVMDFSLVIVDVAVIVDLERTGGSVATLLELVGAPHSQVEAGAATNPLPFNVVRSSALVLDVGPFDKCEPVAALTQVYHDFAVANAGHVLSG